MSWSAIEAENPFGATVTSWVPDPDQPRKEFAPDAIARLAESLKKHGQLQPIRVRWNATVGKWVVISGERRYRASAVAGLKTVACVFVDGIQPVVPVPPRHPRLFALDL